MSGSVFDLSQPNIDWPDPIAVDSHLVVANYQHFFPGEIREQAERARMFFQNLLDAGRQAVLTPTA